MIGQYLSNTNEKTTVSILQNILKLNQASQPARASDVPADATAPFASPSHLAHAQLHDRTKRQAAAE
jgi:hypothetical protein